MSRQCADLMSMAYCHMLRGRNKDPKAVDKTIADFIEQQDLKLVEMIILLDEAYPLMAQTLHRSAGGMALLQRIDAALKPWTEKDPNE